MPLPAPVARSLRPDHSISTLVGFFGRDRYCAWTLVPAWTPAKSDGYISVSSLILIMLFHRVDVD